VEKHATMKNDTSPNNPLYFRLQYFDNATGKACTPWREVHKAEDSSTEQSELRRIAEDRGYIVHGDPSWTISCE